MRAPPVLLCRALREATPSRKSICAQSRRLASSGRMPEYSMIRPQPVTLRWHILLPQPATGAFLPEPAREWRLGGPAYATGCSRRQPRFTAVPKTPFRISRALCLCRGAVSDFSSQDRHSWGMIKRTNLRRFPDSTLTDSEEYKGNHPRFFSSGRAGPP